MTIDDAAEFANTPIIFHGRLTCDDFLSMRRYYGLLVLRKPLRWTILIFLTFLAALCVTALVLRWRNMEMGLIILTVSMVAVWLSYLMFPVQRRWAARRYYQQHAERFKDTEVTLTASRLTIRNELQETSFAWKLVGVVGDTREGLLFCNEAWQPLFWLPQRLFECPETRRRVVQLIEMNNVQIRPLS